MSHEEPRLFIPGPTEVFPEIREILARPLVTHRGEEIMAATSEIFDNLRRLFHTRNECYVATSAATGLMEGAVRNLVQKKVLCLVCGAFGDRQRTVARKCGKDVDHLEFEWGTPVDPDAVRAKLSEGGFDVVTCVHSETSTGILNPIEAIGAVVREFDDVMFVVDCVSSIAGAKLLVDDWGIDVAFAGTQKCLAIPPGLCVFTASPRAMERAAHVPDRGHYFDFLNYRKMAERGGQIPATTSIPLIFALQRQLQRILDEEGIEVRWARHASMAKQVRDAVSPHFPLFPAEGFMTPSESVFANNRDADIAGLIETMKSKGKLFGNGYGDLKGKTFRIGHMGDLQPEHMQAFLDDFVPLIAR